MKTETGINWLRRCKNSNEKIETQLSIKKLKVERARRESLQDKETFTEFTKRFTAENFVDQVSGLFYYTLNNIESY